MPNCSAVNCANGSRNGVRVHRFPKDPSRRQLWIQNCRRDQWTPTDNSVLCDAHFEESEFESNRQDGKRLLKWNAVPTLFDVPNKLQPVTLHRVNPLERKQTLTASLLDDACEPDDVTVCSTAVKQPRVDHAYCKSCTKPIVVQPTEHSDHVYASGVSSHMAHEDEMTESVDMQKSPPSAYCKDARCRSTIARLQLKIRQLQQKLQQSMQREANLEANISKFLNKDQIKKLKQPHDHKGRNIVWSSETIQRCLTIRSVVGRSGYDHLRKMKFPLPSYRTLYRHIQTLSFTPGIQYDVLEWLKVKVSAKESQKLCVLLVDEMQLQSRIEFDKGLRRIVGYVSPETLPSGTASGADKEPATHALVFMLRGLADSWKQTVAYLFTGASLKREPFWKFTQEVIQASEAAGLHIQAVTTDMGPANTGLWNHVGIESTRSRVIPAVTHPCYSSDRLLYFVADPPHLLKNLWNCLLVHQVNLSSQTVQKYNLPSDVVKCFVYVSQLLDAQNCHEWSAGARTLAAGTASVVWGIQR